MTKELRVTRHEDGSYTVTLNGETVTLPDEKSFIEYLAAMAV